MASVEKMDLRGKDFQVNMMEIDGVVSLLMAEKVGTYEEIALLITINKDQFNPLEKKVD